MSTSRETQVANGLLYLLPTAVGSVVPFITLPILTRILSPEQYGAWALAMAYGVVANGVASFGVLAGYERNFFQHPLPHEQAALLYSVVGFVVLTFTLAGSVTWILRDDIANLIMGDASQGVLVFAAFCVNAVSGIKEYYLRYFKNSEDARRYAWYTMDETILGAVGSLVLVAWLRMGLMGLALGQLAASTVILMAVVWEVGRRLRPAFNWSILKDVLAISLPLTPRIVLGVVGSQFDKYLLVLLSSVAGVGAYVIGQKIAYVAYQYMTAIGNVFAPQVYRRMFAQDEASRATIGRYLTPFAYASVAVALAIALFAEEGLRWLVSDAYAGAVPVVSLLCLSYGLMFFGKLPQLEYARKTYLISVLTMVALGLNIAINVLTIPRWGAVGAAAGALTAGMLTSILRFAICQHYYPIRWEYRRMAAIFALLVICAVGATILPLLVPVYPARLAIKLVCLGSFIWLGVRFGYVSIESAKLIQSAVGRVWSPRYGER